jgi:hypothetical protein
MSRQFPPALLALIFGITITASASGTTFYIAANGSDSNNGTSTTTPWLHAPGMPNCTGICATAQPNPGDQFIFRGGDTWHYGNSSAVPYVGSATSPHWNWTWSGSSANCQLNAAAGNVASTSCIYIGVDKNWYNASTCGSSWCRPIMSMDNPFSTNYVSSCSYDESNGGLFWVSGNYVIVDNFEWSGLCWAASGSSTAYLVFFGSMGEATNHYFHGWTLSSVATDQSQMIACASTGCAKASYILVDHNVFDGSDSSLGATTQKASGFALGAGYEISYNIFWHISNGYIGGSAVRIHDNLMYYLMEPSDAASTHGNLFEMQGYNSCSTYFYNNLQYVSTEGEGNDLYSAGNGSSCPVYVFNNIIFQFNGSNCFLEENTGGTGSRTWNVFNNTIDAACFMQQKNITVTQNFQNNHLIGYSPANLTSVGSAAMVDSGNELFQTEAVANGQGYTSSNFYAPTSGGSTIGAGANLTSTCTGLGDSVAQTACESGYGGVTYNQATHSASPNTLIARPSSGAWDAGAYQFTNSTTNPVAPTGLAAVVQ